MALGIILLIFAYLLWKYSKSKYFDAPKEQSKNHRADDCKSFVGCTQFPTTQQDQRYMEMIKRLDHAFKDQKDQVQLRALKRHAFDCKDPVFCVKSVCFVHEPDRIVGTEVVKIKTKRQRTAVRKKELGL